jgi:GT2 family glycosyltransferase/multisubunit Na+/H+ antiporter MnhE subunit
MKLSVIIVNYNVKYFLEQCLISVYKALTDIPAEVWVIDNNSVDGSVEMVRQKFPQVELIANTENTGFSVANNQAIKVSKGEYVLLLNPDTVVEEETFIKCIQFMDEHMDAGALGVRMIDGKGKFLPESKRGLPTPEVALYKMFGLNKIFKNSKKFGKYHLSYLPEHETNEVEVLAGAFMFIRKKTLNEVGLLDETFFMYGEDIDLSYRIINGGYKNYYFPESSIIHYKGESTKKQSVNYVFVFYNAMIIFAKKHYQNKNAGLLIFFIKLAIYLRAGLAVVKRFVEKTWLIFADAALIFTGMYALKLYWEEHIKLIINYPAELMTIHVPYYMFLWILSVYLSGGYEQPYAFKRIFRGVAVGTLLILAVYGLLPNELRFSRALIFLGSIITLGVMMLWRLVHTYSKTGKLVFENDDQLETLIVGNQQEINRVKELLQASTVQPHVIGYVSSSNTDTTKTAGYLGTITQLDELVIIYKIKQIIFCSADIAAKDIIFWMNKIGEQNITYKIVPQESLFIIGSNSKDETGELFTEEIALELSKPYNLRKKRIFDLMVGFILIPLSIILMWFQKKPFVFIKNLLDVLIGNRSWVGYAESGNTLHLPKIKRGILKTTSDVSSFNLNEQTTDKINYLYAKNYNIEKDLNLLLSNLLKL